MPWIAAGGAIAGGIIGSSSSKKAAKQQAAAMDRATAEERRQYDVTRADMEPYRNVGQDSLYTLAELLGLGTRTQLSGQSAAGMSPKPNMPVREAYFKKSEKPTGYQHHAANWMTNSPERYEPIYGQIFDEKAYNAALDKYHKDLDFWNKGAAASKSSDFGSLMKDFSLDDFQADPGYQFRQSEGDQALMRQAAASGRRMAPQTMKELLRFNSDLASQEFGTAYNRDLQNKQRKYNFLGQTAGIGQTSVSQLGQFGANMAGNIGQNMASAGNARAAGTMGQANAWSNTIGQVANAFQQNRTLDQYLKGAGGGGSGVTFTPATQAQMSDMLGPWA